METKMAKNADMVSKPPEPLATFISILSADPFIERGIPGLTAAVWDAIDDPAAPPNSSREELGRRVFSDIVNTFSLETRSFLGPVGDPGFNRRYDMLYDAGQTLRAIAEHNRDPNKGGFERPEALGILQNYGFGEIPFWVTVGLTVGRNGRIQVAKNPLLEAFVDVPVDRIRTCAICDRLFWAIRVNSECCSRKCTNTYNQRSRRRAKPKGSSQKHSRPNIKQTTGTIVELETDDESFYYLDTTNRVLKPLEYQEPSVVKKTKVKRHFWKETYAVSGERSPFRLKVREPQEFIWGTTLSPDHRHPFRCCSLESTGGMREVTSYGGIEWESVRPVRFEKYGERSTKVVPESPLRCGEYMLTLGDLFEDYRLYCFGVD
jgi:hypothetical protein